MESSHESESVFTVRVPRTVDADTWQRFTVRVRAADRTPVERQAGRQDVRPFPCSCLFSPVLYNAAAYSSNLTYTILRLPQQDECALHWQHGRARCFGGHRPARAEAPISHPRRRQPVDGFVGRPHP